jgi:hypothetical protein
MCVLTMPGMTYLPVPSITASASNARPPPSRMSAMTPSCSTMSIGPYGGFALP